MKIGSGIVAAVTLLALTNGSAFAGSHRFVSSATFQTVADTGKAVSKGNTLVGRAVLPAATFAKGPTSGTLIGKGPINGQATPFVNKQPVQGFSAILKNNDGTFSAMLDNGFGSIENSSDFHLRVYTIQPDFKTKTGGKGGINVLSFIELQDPDKKIPFAIVNHFSKERILTGADFDIESMQQAADGTLWFGDEFGPFLIHTDAKGKVLEAPIALPDFDNPGKEIRASQNPYSEESSALRIMNAVSSHARMNGSKKTPVFSPYYVMLDDKNPNTFVPDRQVPPTGSGLAKASSDIFNVTALKNAGYPVVAWTVNDKPSMEALLKLGISGIISDRPDLLWEVVKSYDGNADGKADFLDADGLINGKLFDAQGHRGGRNLRPENTIPAFEAALDYYMTTLELDCGITKDGIPVLDHDPYIESAKARRADGKPYTIADEVLIKNYTAAEIQSTFIADKLLAGRPEQKNDRALSPVSVAFAKAKGWRDAYVMPTLQDVFDFVSFYESYYKGKAGKNHPDALRRAKTAERVRFNIETKINPRTDTDDKGVAFNERTVTAEPFAKAVAEVILRNKWQDRADIQSFDFATLLEVQKKYSSIRTVYLFGDFPKVGNVEDGTNLQDQDGKNTPWLGGLYWPYRQTAMSNPFRARSSGGFEGMAYSQWENKLFPLLEQPLVGGESRTLLIHEFDLASKTYTGKKFKYILEPKASAIGDFVLFSKNRGLVIERDGSQGDLNGFKAIYEIEWKGDNKPVGKRLAVNLMNIADTDGISLPGKEGDVGLGTQFAFPFTTIEDVVVFDDKKIGVINDNNYPFSVGRHVGSKEADDTEFIIVELERALGTEKIEGYTGFTLINADTDKDIMQLKEGDKVYLPALPTRNLNIQADFGGGAVGSVVFDWNDKKKVKVENFREYTLAGDDKGDYKALTLPAGVHTLIATPYSLPDGKGSAGQPIKVTFAAELGAIINFTLVNADTDTDLMPLKDGDKLDLATLPTRNLNIRANTDTEAIESVVFGLNEQASAKVENFPAYTLGGDDLGDYKSFTLPVGKHTLTATPYAADHGAGVAGKSLSITFEVMDSETSVASAVETAHMKLYPNPSEEVVHVQLEQYPGKTVQISIWDASGNQVHSEEKTIATGNETITLDVARLGLKKGLFYIKVGSQVIRMQKN
jgi:glycerophosphoryl diester phosphodiesterase